jgi:uncharacterized spore protein YtfJ
MAEVLKSIVEPLRNSAAVKSVFGDAISAQGKTVIPVARIAYGFGGGSGKNAQEDKPGEGEGGGGGVVATPLGVFEVTDSETRFIPLHENRKYLAGALAGLIVGFLWARRFQRSKLRSPAVD